MRRPALALAAAALAGWLWTCRGNETGPVSGELVVRLNTSSTSDRALLFRLVGRQTAIAAEPGHGYTTYVSNQAYDTTVIAVVAQRGTALAAGNLVRFSVNDTRQVDSYAAVLMQVAASDYQLRDVRQYALTVEKP